MEKSAPVGLKVIIVGAGISGLVLAHVLSRADIDFTVVEAHEDILSPAGGSLGIWPNAARILDQIGCWETIERACAPLVANNIRQPDGTPFIRSQIAAKIASVFGYDFRVLERHALVRILYDSLHDKTKVLTGVRVVDIVSHDTGVQVLFDRGEAKGDIVVGCDGVHSTVRRIMWEDANKMIPMSITAEEKRSLSSSYRCLVGACPIIPGIALNEANMIQSRGRYMMVVTQPQQILFFVCIKEQEISRWPKRYHFTAEDAEKEAAKILDVPVTTHLLFGEIWTQRTRGYLCSLEEGIFEHWSFGRTVLVGDSAHKLSPVGAHGGNCAIESAAAFANSLVEHLQTRQHVPDNAAIHGIFRSYQTSREKRVLEAFKSVHMMTRLGTWDTLLKKHIARYVLPWIDDVAAVSTLVRGAVKVDFIAAPTRSKGFVGEAATDQFPGQRTKWAALVNVYEYVGGTCYSILLGLQSMSNALWLGTLKS